MHKVADEAFFENRSTVPSTTARPSNGVACAVEYVASTPEVRNPSIIFGTAPLALRAVAIVAA